MLYLLCNVTARGREGEKNSKVSVNHIYPNLFNLCAKVKFL